MTISNLRLFTPGLGLVALVLAISGLCPAQTPNPRNHVTVYTVKPDMLAEWIDLQKNEVVPALKKAGVRSRSMWRNAPFNGSLYEFLSVTPIDNMAQYDGDNPINRALGRENGQRLQAKLRRCLEGSRSFVGTGRPDLGNPGGAGRLPKIAVFARYRLTPGKAQDLENFLKTEIQPVYKKGNVNYTVSQRGFGTSFSDWTMVTSFEKFADLEGGTALQKLVGREEAAKINAKAAPFRTLVEVMVRAIVPDLSFVSQ